LSVLQFQDRFATEEDCVRFLFEKRWSEGWICPKCGNNRCYPIKERGLYECAACRYQASVTAGTILHKTQGVMYYAPTSEQCNACIRAQYIAPSG